MNLQRRKFLQVVSGCGLSALATEASAFNLAREPKKAPEGAIGVLYDSTICIGCQACVSACKEANGLPPETDPSGLWEAPIDLSDKTYTVIRLYREGSGKTQNQEKDGFAFMKRSCMHCADPSCASVCPVSAFTKDPENGIVTYNEDACCGCRYCFVACPFNVPTFEWDSAFPIVQKCRLCIHRYDQGDYAACCQHCPTGASLFGTRKQLLEEAHRRLLLKPGDWYDYPIGNISSGDSSPKKLEVPYQEHIYGEKESGGTQFLSLSAVPFEKAGLPEVPEISNAAIAEGLQHTLYKGFIAPLALFGGLVASSYSNFRKHPGTEEAPTARERVAAQSAPFGSQLFTIPFYILLAIAAVAGILIIKRFIFGIGAVTNMNNGYPWGIWIAYDVVVGTALACGGYAMALLVYIFNGWRYHSLVRPAILTSMFGYTLAGASIVLDLGRYWNIDNYFIPRYINANSILYEVAICIMAYTAVLMIEFSPAFMEKFKPQWLKSLKKAMFVIVAVGALLPTMHQSSLGSLMVAAGHKLGPLWQTNLLPLLFLFTALTMGYGMVVLESLVSSVGFKRPLESGALSRISAVIPWLLFPFVLARFLDILSRGEIGAAFSWDIKGNMFLLENILLIIPLALLCSRESRENPRNLFIAAATLVLAGAFYRFNVYLVGFDPGPNWTYFPAVSEIMITFGLISFEIMGYLFFVKKLPVLAQEE